MKRLLAVRLHDGLAVMMENEMTVLNNEDPADPSVHEPRGPIAQLEWSLYVPCPKCGWSNDLSDATHDSEHEIAKRIFTNDWSRLDGWDVVCEGCSHEFQIERVEY